MSKHKGPGFGPPGGAGAPFQKAKNFRGTLKRLIRYLKPLKFRLLTVFIAAILSTIFTILGPKILGKATTKIFEGVSLKMAGVPGAGIDDYLCADIRRMDAADRAGFHEGRKAPGCARR